MIRRKGKEKKRFQMRQSKNLFIQAVIMLPLSALQNFLGFGVIAGIVVLIQTITGVETQYHLGILQVITGIFFAGAAAVAAAMIMVKFKGAESTEIVWNPIFEYDFSKARTEELARVYRTAKKYFKLKTATSEDEESESSMREFYAREIRGIDLTDMKESDRNYIQDELSHCKKSGGNELHVSAAAALWAVLSPIVLLLQWVAVCAAINSIFSRRIFSCYGELPFPFSCLKSPFWQEACHFLFNFVIISDATGYIDEIERVGT